MEPENKVCYHSFNSDKQQKEGLPMDIMNILLVGIMVVLGGIPSIYILVSMPVILVEKIIRKVKYGTSLYD